MHGSSRKKTEFYLSIRRFKSLTRPTAGADGNKRLIDRPRRASRIDLWMHKRGEPLLLICLQAKVCGQGNRSRNNEQYANQIAKRYSADEEQCQQDWPPNNTFPQVRLHQNEKTGRANNYAAKQETNHWVHLAELTKKQSQHHNAADDRQLRRLEINRSQMKPAARPIAFR